ncbi:hypothetical protein Niako_4774 [Niastella koreensis GR20-10]|uniref:Uncharacterized protein n=1 Tax=Niastella koreensis (strain DSM 17620 / KACC 11465 / NBRC 106392 / GR20-10) TaxID=700598 RepID=G8TQ24_NIAKG|nr:hypothetical protein Niako_4774 [Niastella koreensis GR20-10]
MQSGIELSGKLSGNFKFSHGFCENSQRSLQPGIEFSGKLPGNFKFSHGFLENSQSNS